MAIKFIDRITPNGVKFYRFLEEIADKEVRIGFQRGKATDERGVDYCDIAMWNELGTSHSPSRPFMRKSVDENKSEINAFLDELKKQAMHGAKADQVLKTIGIFQKDLIQAKITDGNFAPNAPSTIRKKKSSKPLIDTGRMRQSVNYEIKKKGGSR